MNKTEFLERIQGLEGEPMFRRVMQLVAQEEVECYLEFTEGPLAYQQPKLRLWFQEGDEYDAPIEVLTLLLAPQVVAIMEED